MAGRYVKNKHGQASNFRQNYAALFITSIGQMELYLRWLAKNETEPGEQSPMGIILCAGKKRCEKRRRGRHGQ
jgi:hypothetical protein